MSEEIPKEIREFLRRYISSVGQLDILFLLFKHPDRFWTAQQISQELRTNQSLAQTQLEELAQKGLILVEGEMGARCCGEPEHLESLTKLVSFYSLRRAVVIEFIYSQPLDRIRIFADAFRIKKD